jgi:hypothetical protein
MLEKLLMTPLVDTEPMQPQINALILALQQLAMAGLSVNDKLLAYLLILRLPESYLTLKTVLSSLDSTKAMSKSMLYQIYAEERRCIQLLGGSVVTFYVKAQKGGKSNKDKNNKKCSH